VAEFQVLRDSYRASLDDDFVSGVAWIYDGTNIRIVAGSAWSRERAEAERDLDYGRSHGFTEAEIWEGLLEHGGNGYTMLRTGPFEVTGTDVYDVGTTQLAQMAKT
jgi:hypothetical protein